MSKTSTTAPPTPAPMPMILESSGPFEVLVGVEVADAALVDAASDMVGSVAVGANDDDFALDTDDGVDVVLALVEAPATAPCRVNTAVSVLQHLCLSAWLSQQYWASFPYPVVPHCHTSTPFVLKSYALALFGVSWLSWHSCGQSDEAHVLSVQVPRAYSIPVVFVASITQSPLLRHLSDDPQHCVKRALPSQGTSVLAFPSGK